MKVIRAFMDMDYGDFLPDVAESLSRLVPAGFSGAPGVLARGDNERAIIEFFFDDTWQMYFVGPLDYATGLATKKMEEIVAAKKTESEEMA